MFPVPYSQIHHHPEQALFSAEASEIGLAPGEWPDFLAVMREDDPQQGVLFQRTGGDPRRAVDYHSKHGVLLRVFND